MHVLGSESSLVSRAGSEKEREKNSNKRDADQREEWMLNPGEDRAIAGQLCHFYCYRTAPPLLLLHLFTFPAYFIHLHNSHYALFIPRSSFPNFLSSIFIFLTTFSLIHVSYFLISFISCVQIILLCVCPSPFIINKTVSLYLYTSLYHFSSSLSFVMYLLFSFSLSTTSSSMKSSRTYTPLHFTFHLDYPLQCTTIINVTFLFIYFPL